MEVYFYIALVKYVSGGILLRGYGFNTVKLFSESNLYHMHLEESRTVHALEIW